VQAQSPIGWFGMQEEDFEKLMRQIDKDLAGKGMPAVFRAIHAYHQIEGPGELNLSASYDPSRPQYEGTNLFHGILSWYDHHYPKGSVCAPSLGRRVILIRAEPFMLTLPPAFNIEPQTLPAIQHVDGMSEGFLMLLDPTEKECIQAKFNTCFTQASRLALLCVKVRRRSVNANAALIKDLILSARADLNSATDAVVRPDAGSYVWCSQQAVEKFFKAFLAFSDTSMNIRRFKQLGHDLKKLGDECCNHCAAVDQVLPFLHEVACTPQERYQPPNLLVADSVAKVDMAYAICDLVVQIMLHGAGADGAALAEK
jgi:hypothetical protein